VKITREGLLARAKFANTPLAEEYFSLYKDGHMKAFSMGWITRAFEMRDTKLPDGTSKRIRWFTKVELIEISAVAIPANRESLVRAASAAPGRREQKGERLGRRIRAAREEKEMTLEQVAAELPITASTLQNIENGTIIRPPDEVLRAIAAALDLMIDIMSNLDIEAAVDNAMQQDAPLKAVGDLRRFVGDGYTLNAVVSQCAQHVEDAVKAALDNSAANLKTELGIPS